MSESGVSVPLLVPDMPSAGDLLPYLQQIDANRCYTNFGPLVAQYEGRLSGWLGERSGLDVHVVTVSSGTAALELGLSVLGLQPGARVLLPGITFVASATAVTRMGFVPVFTDVDVRSWLLTPELARGVIAHTRVDAVMPVATFGVPHAVGDWDRFTVDTGIPVLIDAAAALSSQDVGSTTVCAYSLHATKPLGVGEGGVVAAADGKFAGGVRALSNFGLEGGRATSHVGTNAKLSEYHAAVGLAQFDRKDDVLRRYVSHRGRYENGLKACSGAVGLQFNACKSAQFSLNVCLHVEAGRVVPLLREAGIETRRWYLPPVCEHFYRADVMICSPAGDRRLSVIDGLSSGMLGLPFHNSLEDSDIDYVVSTLAGVIGQIAG